MTIDIILPTVNRADRLADLVANIHEATKTPHTIYLVMEATDRDSIDAAAKLDTIDVIGDFGACSVAVNFGYWGSDSPFFAVANDDVRFHEGWDEIALDRFTDDLHVVGLNDGSGDCKCFHLVRRSFIEDESGVFDKPNTVYHTYKSQCVDTEFSLYAQVRNVYTEAPGAVLEHIHWRWQKADRDEPNYVKARATTQEDLAEYNRRRELWDPKGQTPPCSPQT